MPISSFRKPRWRGARAVTVCLLVAGATAVVFRPPAEGQTERQRKLVADVQWVDAETEAVIFAGDDLLGFDWDRQVMLLTQEAAIDLISWMARPRQYRRFVLRDREGEIYQGQYVSTFSSRSFSGPTLGVSQDPALVAPYFPISNGYPAGGPEDQRFALRLRDRLQEAGLLRPLDPDKYRHPIRTKHTEWRGTALKVWVTYFEDTFEQGREARALLRLADPERLVAQGRVLEVTFDVISFKGTFHSRTTLPPVPMEQAADGLVVCRFDPWTALPGYDPQWFADGGGGYVWVEAVVREGDGGAAVAAVITPPLFLGIDFRDPRDTPWRPVPAERAPGLPGD